MTMTPLVRKFALTTHVISSVAWFGAIVGFLALAVAGLTSQSDQMVRAAYLGADLMARFVIVPLCLASFITGLVSSLGTEWGLFKHYWVLVKLLMTIPSTIILLIHMQPIGYLAHMAAETTLLRADSQETQLLIAAVAALLVLLVETVLSVYKPRGMTSYGWRKQQKLHIRPEFD
jgi:hypothetical protein